MEVENDTGNIPEVSRQFVWSMSHGRWRKINTEANETGETKWVHPPTPRYRDWKLFQQEPACELKQAAASRYTKGPRRKGSYRTSQCTFWAVHLALLLSRGHWTPWLFSRCQKSEDISSSRQIISIVVAASGFLTLWEPLFLIILQENSKRRRREDCFRLDLDHIKGRLSCLS